MLVSKRCRFWEGEAMCALNLHHTHTHTHTHTHHTHTNAHTAKQGVQSHTKEGREPLEVGFTSAIRYPLPHPMTPLVVEKYPRERCGS